MLRLDEDDPAAAWRERVPAAARGRREARRSSGFDALRFEGPGTDLTIGLLPTSRFAQDGPASTTVDGINHIPNLPTEEVVHVARPARADGVVTATKPLDVERHARARAARPLRGRPRRRDRGRRRAPTRCARAARRTRARRGSARSRSSTARAASARPAPSSSTRSSTRTRRATSRSGTPTRPRVGERGPRPHQLERDPHRLHDRLRRRLRHRAARRTARDVPVLRGGAWQL